MRKSNLLACLVLGLTSCILSAAPIPLLDSAAASDRHLAEARQEPRLFVANLSKGDSGMLYEGDVTLPAGRYRLRALVGGAPVGSLGVGAVFITLDAGTASHQWPLQLLASDDDLMPVALTIQHAGGKLPIRLGWRVYESKLHASLKDQRALAIAKLSGGGGGPQLGGTAGGGDDLFGDGGGDDFDFDLSENELQSLDAARQTPVRAVAAGLHLRQLPPLHIEVFPGKLVYQPGEAASATITITNHGPQAVETELTVERRGGLSQVEALPPLAVRLAPGATTTETVTFPTEGLRWGASLQLASDAGSGQAAFAVTDNFWDVHQYTFEGNLAGYTDPERAERQVRKWREEGYTAIEALFWAPDDMFEFTPDEEYFFGAQGAYPGTISGTRNIINTLHDNGMSMTFYANWWGGGGPPAFEMMRKHPEWFANANYHAWVLDDWDLLTYWQNPELGEVRAPGAEWSYVPMAMPTFAGAFEEHAREIVGAIEQFSFDAIRYDSAYSDDWNVRGMQLVHRIVDPGNPDFRYGMNSFAPQDARSLQLPNFRGGCVMGEGLRIERVQLLSKWLAELMRWRDVCWPYDVQVMPLYQHGDENEPSPLDQTLAVASHYAGGAHFGAHPPVTPYGNASAFALRYSEYLWDTRQRRPRQPADLIALPGEPKLLQTDRMVHVVDRGDGRQRLLIHLLNVPADYRLYSGFASAAPAPLTDQVVAINLPDGARIERATQLSPFLDGWQAPLAVDGNRLTVPELRFWRLLVIDIAGGAPIPTVVSLQDEQMSYLREWRVDGPYPVDEEKELPGHDALAPLSFPLDVSAWPVHQQELLPVDMQAALGEENRPYVSGYAWVNLRSERGRDVQIFAKADDAIAVWLRGEPVLAKRLGPLRQFDELSATVRLQAGDNPVLVKVTNQWLAMSFVLRFAELDGTPLTDGVTYTTEPTQ